MSEEYKVGNCRPPLEHRFPANRPPAPNNKKHPHGYLTSRLRKFLAKKIKYEDPETQQMITGTVRDAIVWRFILNATQGENQAIEGIFDRIEGKLKSQALVDQSTHYHITNFREFVDNAYRGNGKAHSIRDGAENPSRLPQ